MIRASVVAALVLGAAVWVAIFLGLGGWPALGLAAICLFGFVAIANSVNYGHTLPPRETDGKPPWWR